MLTFPSVFLGCLACRFPYSNHPTVLCHLDYFLSSWLLLILISKLFIKFDFIRNAFEKLQIQDDVAPFGKASPANGVPYGISEMVYNPDVGDKGVASLAGENGCWKARGGVATLVFVPRRPASVLHVSQVPQCGYGVARFWLDQRDAGCSEWLYSGEYSTNAQGEAVVRLQTGVGREFRLRFDARKGPISISGIQ